MNLNLAKEFIKSHLNVYHVFQYKGSRNQIEEFSGRIVDCYSSIFLIQMENNMYKSFSYNDFIAKFFIFIS